jgi:hypothetical protein
MLVVWGRQRRLALPGLLLGLASLACGPAGGSAKPAAPPAGTPLAVDSVARLTVGVARGDSTRELDRVVTPFLLPDGRLVVPVAGSSTIRLFAPDGELLRSLGRPGEGPGEFRSLEAAWPRGDTIEAFDDELGRITRFPPEGPPLVVRLHASPSDQAVVPGALPDGWALYGVEEAGTGRRDRVVVRRFARDGSAAGVIARVEGMARRLTSLGGGPDPLSPRTAFAAHGGRVYVAETLTPAIHVLGPSGRLEREIRWRPTGTLSPDVAFREAVDAAVDAAGPDRAAGTRERLESFPVRYRVPAFWDFRVDEEGFIWVQPFDPAEHSMVLPVAGGAGRGSGWLILSPVGSSVGTVKMPDRFEPSWITRDQVVGIHRDDLGVELVQVRALKRG